jgi:hypothetical protein
MATRILQLRLLAQLSKAIDRLPEFDVYSTPAPTPLLPAGQKLQVRGQVYPGQRMCRRAVLTPRRVLFLSGFWSAGGSAPFALRVVLASSWRGRRRREVFVPGLQLAPQKHQRNTGGGFCRCVDGEGPFLVTKLSPYYDR